MSAKRIIVAAAALLALLPCASAQESSNPIILASMHSLVYDYAPAKKSAGAVIGEVTAAVLAGQSSRQRPDYERAVKAAIVKGMSQSFRLRVVEGQLTAEEAASPYSIYVDGTVSDITSTTKNETVTYEEKGQKKTRVEVYYRGQISVTLLVKSAIDDGVIASPTFNVSESDMSWVNNEEKALTNALNTLSNRVTRFFDKMYPLGCNIIERSRVKNDKQKEVYIDLGYAHGLSAGQTLGVFAVRYIADKEARTQVARLRVKRVEGDEVSLCRVVSGGRDLKTALDEGATLIINTL